MTEQVYFNYNPFYLTRLMINMYVNKQLNNFGNTNETFYIQKAVQDTMEYVSDEFLEDIMETIAKEHGCTEGFNIANHIDIIFDRVVKTDEFKKYLKNAFLDIPPFDNYIVDKTTGKIYKTNFAHHFETVMDIIQLHPELDTVEKQDDFVMTKLKLVGTNNEQNYYTPKDLVYHDNSKPKLKSFDYYNNFLKIYKKYKDWEVNSRVFAKPLGDSN